MYTTRKVPIKLDNARAFRAYLGGSLLDQFHGVVGEDGHFPEEWIMSVTPARNPGREHMTTEGLSKLADNEMLSLKTLIEEAPERMLGESHIEQVGTSLGVLVKIIDSAERLPVQVHPDRGKAKEYLNSVYGKTECWHILGGRSRNGEAPYVYFGFKEGITREHWQEVFYQQDIEGILNCMHRFEVKEGDTILIEGGIPHAIGAGCFLIEIQEPTDYTFRVEKKTSRGYALSDEMCHQGIGYDKMFDCFHYGGFSREETMQKWFIKPKLIASHEGGTITSLIGYDNTEYFAMNILNVEKEIIQTGTKSFLGLYGLQGEGRIITGEESIPIQKGDQFFVPADRKDFVIKNDGGVPLKVLQFFGPSLGL